jgi:hypothetical protein
MAKTKYGHLIVREPFNDNPAFPPFHKMMLYFSRDVTDEVGFSLRYTYVNAAKQVESSHKHDHTQFLCFLGTPDNIEEFPAEVEFFLGEELEKHIINTTTVIYVPAGVYHAPINFKRVDKPIMFINCVMGSEYVRKEQNGKEYSGAWESTRTFKTGE